MTELGHASSKRLCVLLSNGASLASLRSIF